MAIIPGTMGIKSWSYEMVITPEGEELCEDCHNLFFPFDSGLNKADLVGSHYYSYETPSGVTKITCDCSPIFASDEMDRSSVCDHCEYESDLHNIIEY